MPARRGHARLLCLEGHGFSRSEALAPLRPVPQRLASSGQLQPDDVDLQPVNDAVLLSLGAVDSAPVLAGSFAAEPPQVWLEANALEIPRLYGAVGALDPSQQRSQIVSVHGIPATP